MSPGRQIISVRVNTFVNQSGRESVVASLFGNWAAHKDIIEPGGEPGWTVTHVASGLAAQIGLDLVDAINVARALGAADPIGARTIDPYAESPEATYEDVDDPWLMKSIIAEALDHGRCDFEGAA